MLMRQLREAQGAQLRGIAISGYGMPEDVMRSVEAGFSVHLTKPVEIEALEAALRQTSAQPS
jgi:CheY-like chemotaxis protein